MKCDQNCPPMLKFFCCNNCRAKEFTVALKDKFPDLWNDRTGFYRDSVGCVLGEERPEECKAYDCRKYKIFLSLNCIEGVWCITSLYPVEESDVTREFIDAYNKVMEISK